MSIFPPVTLGDLAEALPGAELRGDRGTTVVDVVFDHREAVPDSLFCAVPGSRADGHEFVGAAAGAGSNAALVSRWVAEAGIPQLRVPSVREAMGPAAAIVFGSPGAAMTMVGITGTNGKTTCAYLLESVFATAGMRVGVVGTTGARIDGEPVPLARTTPEAPDLHRLLARMRDAGVRAVAMEVSSHALEQHRVGGLRFDVALFTNLSQDHLDYHGTMDTYFETKARLFTPDYASRGAANLDDPRGRELVDRAAIPTVSFGFTEGAGVRGADPIADRRGLSLRVGDLELRSSLLGAFNASNLLATMAASRLLGIDDRVAARGIAALPGVPGRMEPVEVGQRFLVVVDYAHTPDSIRSVLRGARSLAAGRIVVVFGCGGDRDHTKRSPMGEAATSNADRSIITSDNPRSEDPASIIAAVERGARRGGGPYEVEPNRRLAIRAAVRAAEPGDVVVIAGKGHEDTQETAGVRIPFDDRVVAAEEIRARLAEEGA